MAVAHVTSGTTGTATGTATLSVTIASGSDRLLIAAVGLRNAQAVTALTFDGNALSDVATVLNPATTGNNIRRTVVRRLVAPDVKTADLVVTTDGSNQVRLSGSSFTGVDATTPLGTPSTDEGLISDESATVNPASAVGDLVYDVITLNAQTPGHGASQTEIFAGTNNAIGSSGSTKAGAATSTAMSKTFTTSTIGFTYLAVAIKPVAAAGGNQDADITEGADLGDSFIAVASSFGSLSDGAMGGDSYAAAATALASISEGASGGDSGLSLAATLAGLAEAALAGDTQAAAAAAQAALMEGAAAGESWVASAAAIAVLSEGASAGDVFADLGDTTLAAISEGSLAGETFAAAAAVIVAASQGALAGEALLGLVAAAGSWSEGAKAGDMWVGVAESLATIAEGAEAGDSISGVDIVIDIIQKTVLLGSIKPTVLRGSIKPTILTGRIKGG